jgi:hypothetical protein
MRLWILLVVLSQGCRLLDGAWQKGGELDKPHRKRKDLLTNALT